MNIHEWAERLGTTVAGFARISKVSRATVNSWGADPDKTYSAVPRPQTLLDMADSLDEHGEEARRVASELREAAGDTPVIVDLSAPPEDTFQRRKVLKAAREMAEVRNK